MRHRFYTYIGIGVLLTLLVGAKEQCEIAKLDMRGTKWDDIEKKQAQIYAHIYKQTEKKYNIYTPGREWTYKTTFLNAQGDTTKSKSITLKVLEERHNNRITILWYSPDTSLNEYSFVEEDDNYDVVIYPPTKQDFQFTQSATFPQFIYYIDSPSTKKMDGEEWIMRYRGPSAAIRWTKGDKINSRDGKDVSSIKSNLVMQAGTTRTEYYRALEQKNISTPAGEFQNCWQVETRGSTKKDVIYKAIFYFHPEYGFVRWEYTKPDSTQVIFDLEKISGFAKSTP